jgi:apolipoprotein D and lipocalin family protein
MKILSFSMLFILSLQLSPAAFSQKRDLPVLQTVPSVDLNRYQGVWHQIAYFPQWFQRNCEKDVTATYTLGTQGEVIVENTCFKLSGTRKTIKGYAYPVDQGQNAKLKVKFFWFAPAGDYWIIDLGADYEYVVVGNPDRKSLWILSRTPQMSKTVYDSLLEKLKLQAYDVSRLKLTSTLLER